MVNPKKRGSTNFNKILSIPPIKTHSILFCSSSSIKPAEAKALKTSPLPFEPDFIE